MPSIRDLEQLLGVDPDDAFVLYGLAQEHAKAGDASRAVEYFDRCLRVDPAYCYAYYHKARVQAAAGARDAARETLRAGLEAARRADDGHALDEIQCLLDTLEERT